MSFGEKLQTLRKEAGLSQEDLADQLGVSRQAVSKWERDSGYPETEKLLHIARLFQVTVDYLLMEESTGEELPPGERGYYVSRETAAGFLAHQRRRLHKLGGGVGLLVAILSLPVWWSQGGELLSTLAMIAGIVLLFSAKLTGNPYRRLRWEPLTFDPAVKAELSGEYAEKKAALHGCALAGIALMAFGLLFCPQLSPPSPLEALLDALDLVLVGGGAYLYIYMNGLRRSYRRLLQTGEAFLDERK